MNISHSPQAVERCELSYASLQLPTWSLKEEPEMPRQVEVEYSTVVSVSTGRWLMWRVRVPERERRAWLQDSRPEEGQV